MLKGQPLTVIIPVRGGSKGIPRKNLYKFGKDSLLERSIKIALLSNFVDKVFVSTDDNEMFGIASKYNVNTKNLRKKILSNDTASTIDVIKDVINEQDISKGFILLLQVTSATRTLKNLEEFFINFNNADKIYDSSVSLVELDSPHPDKVQIIKKARVFSYLGKESMVPRQSLSKVYKLNGAFYLSKISSFFENKSFFSENTLPFIMNYLDSFNLDNLSDVYTLEALVEKGIITIKEYD